MKINNIGPSNAINHYNDNKKKITKSNSVEKNDSLQISTEGRALSNLSIDYPNGNSAEKVEAIKNQISQGTYAPNAKLIATKMLDAIKGRGI